MENKNKVRRPIFSKKFENTIIFRKKFLADFDVLGEKFS